MIYKRTKPGTFKGEQVELVNFIPGPPGWTGEGREDGPWVPLPGPDHPTEDDVRRLIKQTAVDVATWHERRIPPLKTLQIVDRIKSNKEKKTKIYKDCTGKLQEYIKAIDELISEKEKLSDLMELWLVPFQLFDVVARNELWRCHNLARLVRWVDDLELHIHGCLDDVNRARRDLE